MRSEIIPSASTTRKQAIFICECFGCLIAMKQMTKTEWLKRTTILLFLMILQARNLDRAQWGTLSLLPTASPGLEGVRGLLHVCPWFCDCGLVPVYFGLVELSGQLEQGKKGSKESLVWLCWGTSRF